MAGNLTNFENSVKDALNGFEMPYDVSQWDELASKLDNSSTSVWSHWSRVLMATGVISIIGLTFYLVNDASHGNEGLSPEMSVQLQNGLMGDRFDKEVRSPDSTELSSSSSEILTINSDTLEELSLKNKAVDSSGDTNPVSNLNVEVNLESSQQLDVAVVDSAPASLVENSDEIYFVSSVKETCAGLEIDFNLTKGEVEGSYLWNFGDGDFSSQANPSHSYKDPGIYDISLSVRSEEDGQIRSKTIKSFITINPVPDASFDWEFVNAPTAAPDVRFINTSERASQAEWVFDSKMGSQDINPKFSYVDGGDHEVILTVTNEYGCVDKTVSYITIEDDYKLNAVRSFTPNGDGKNDVFMPEALVLNNYRFKLTVYDQKQSIFETKSVRKPWDGHIDGEIAPEGDYPWVVILYNSRGEEERYFSSTITITP